MHRDPLSSPKRRQTILNMLCPRHISSCQWHKLFLITILWSLIQCTIIFLKTRELHLLTDNSTTTTSPHQHFKTTFITKQQRSIPPSTPSYPPLYTNLSCPLEVSIFSNAHRSSPHSSSSSHLFQLRAELGQNLSLSSHSLSIVHDAVSSGAFSNRTVLFLGDSLLRQPFISIGCLAGEGLVEELVIPWEVKFSTFHENDVTGGVHSGYNSGRYRLRGGGDLIFWHLVDRFDKGEVVPMIFDETKDVKKKKDRKGMAVYSWLESCRKGTEFVVPIYDHLFYDREKETTTTTTRESPSIRNIFLTKDDVVIINAGVHPQRRSLFLERFANVLDCLSEAAKSSNGSSSPSDLLRPTIIYVMTPQQHFRTPTGSYDRRTAPKGMEDSCASVVDVNEKGEEDERLFRDKVDGFLGDGIDWKRMGDYHVQGVDCTHYTQPGVPDLLAAEISTFVKGLRDDGDLVEGADGD